jgi:hypothetical protein
MNPNDTDDTRSVALYWDFKNCTLVSWQRSALKLHAPHRTTAAASASMTVRAGYRFASNVPLAQIRPAPDRDSRRAPRGTNFAAQRVTCSHSLGFEPRAFDDLLPLHELLIEMHAKLRGT